MAVSAYFGLPGSGKTTLLAYFAKKAVKSKRYKNVYSNVRLSIPGVVFIPNEAIGVYQLEDGLILIDEATLFANNREHKEFPRHVMEFFLLHRHYNVDIMLFLQEATGYDKKIRSITDRVFYVYKGFFTGFLFTRFYRIPYGIIIPDPKKNGGAQLGEILQGYRKPGIFYRIFAPSVFRPLYYRYFNSWERKQLTPLPPCYTPYKKPQRNKNRYFVAFAAWMVRAKQGFLHALTRAKTMILGKIPFVK